MIALLMTMFFACGDKEENDTTTEAPSSDETQSESEEETQTQSEEETQSE